MTQRWPYVRHNGEDYLFRCIAALPSVGLESDTGELVAFAITHSDKVWLCAFCVFALTIRFCDSSLSAHCMWMTLGGAAGSASCSCPRWLSSIVPWRMMLLQRRLS